MINKSGHNRPSPLNDFTQHRGLTDDEVELLHPLLEQDEVRGKPVGFQGRLVIVEFRQGENVRSIHAAGNRELAAARLICHRIRSLFRDEAYEFIHPLRVYLHGDQ